MPLIGSDNIYNNLYNNKTVIYVLLDLAKTFHTVDHKILINVHEDRSFREVVLNFIKLHVTDRLQYVLIKRTLRESRNIKVAVPQGTVLIWTYTFLDLCKWEIWEGFIIC